MRRHRADLVVLTRTVFTHAPLGVAREGVGGKGVDVVGEGLFDLRFPLVDVSIGVDVGTSIESDTFAGASGFADEQRVDTEAADRAGEDARSCPAVTAGLLR